LQIGKRQGKIIIARCRPNTEIASGLRRPKGQDAKRRPSSGFGQPDQSRKKVKKRVMSSTAQTPAKPGKKDGGRDKDRTCDPYDVNVVLSR
jgi:hypothetical protein